MLIQDKRNKYRKAIEAIENCFPKNIDLPSIDNNEEFMDREELILLCLDISDTFYDQSNCEDNGEEVK